MRRALTHLFLLTFLWLGSYFTAFSIANGSIEPESVDPESTSHGQKKFIPGDFIFDHIGDSHEWHLVTIGGVHITIPLPVILYSRTRNHLSVFFSNKFHHGHEAYMGYMLKTEGEFKGKIVEVNANGAILEGAALPLDFSIKKNVAAIFFSLIIMLWLFIGVANSYKKNPNRAPKGVQNLIETIILFIREDIAKPAMGHNHTKFLPFLLSIFFFIWINNLLGLIPIFPAGANVTGNIAVTMALALFSFFVINLNANKHYWKHIVNTPGVPWFLKVPIPIMPVVEIAGLFIKPFVLMVRLFANILAGHMIVMVLFSLIFIFGAINEYFGFGISAVSILLVVFMTMLELLVAAIQAYVFTMLTAIFIGMATAEHH
jgi:F-type H+-transporting ATPase subunit a